MPHLILECSENLIGVLDRRALLLELHGMLAGTALFSHQDIKGRFVVHDVFVLGDGSSDGAFVHLDIRILEGRADEVKAMLTEKALKLLEHHLSRALEPRRCSVTVEISEIHRASYKKKNR